MRSLWKLTAGPAVLALLAGLALGQQGAGSPTTGSQSGQKAQSGTSSSYLSPPLYQSPSVRRELNLTERQYNQLNDAYGRLQGQYRNDISGLGRLSDRERAARAADLNRRLNNDFLRSAGDILTEQQMTRLRQLDLQNRGLGAFSDPAVRKRLNRTEDQVNRLNRLNADYQRQMNQLRDLSRTNRDEALRRYGTLRSGWQDQVNDVFNDNQRRTWNDMAGRPFDFGAPSDFSRPPTQSSPPPRR